MLQVIPGTVLVPVIPGTVLVPVIPGTVLVPVILLAVLVSGYFKNSSFPGYSYLFQVIPGTVVFRLF